MKKSRKGFEVIQVARINLLEKKKETTVKKGLVTLPNGDDEESTVTFLAAEVVAVETASRDTRIYLRSGAELIVGAEKKVVMELINWS